MINKWVQITRFEQNWGEYAVVAVKVRNRWEFKAEFRAEIRLGNFLDWPFATAREARKCCEDDFAANKEDTLKPKK